MSDDEDLLDLLLARAGTTRLASEITGIHERLIQRWVAGHARPSNRNRARIKVALDGDDALMRKKRLELYAERAARKQSCFDRRMT